MRSFTTIAGFEIAQRLRRLSTWIYFGVFFALAFLFFIASAGAFAGVNVGFGTGGKVMVNSPYTLATIITALSVFMLPITAALAGQSIHQDFEHRTYAHIFTAPVGKGAYLGGRFFGTLTVLVLIHASVGLGCAIGSVMPFVDEKLIGPQRAMAFIAPYLVGVGPNLLITAPVFFALGALLRKMRTVYVTAVVLLLGNFIAGALSGEIENKLYAALLDPLGGFAFERVTEYWSVAEKNTRLVPLAGVLLANRLIWLAVAVGALVLTGVRFRMAEPLERGASKDVARAPEARAGPARVTARPAPPRALALWPRLTWLHFRETVKSVHFVVLALGGVLFIIGMATMSGLIYGTATYPVTRQMIELGHGSFRLFALAIIIVYAGDLVWRERDARIDQIVDASPVPSGVLYASKLGALMLVGLALHLIVILCGIGIQIAKGYHHFELDLYAIDLLGLRMVQHFHVAVLALFFQVLLPSKHLGQFAMVLYYVVGIVLPIAGFEHRLYRYGASPGYQYSDMNGYGHTLAPWAWFNLYWTLAAVLLAGFTNLLWPRGQETGLGQRLRLARARFRGGVRWALGGVALAFVATGAFIFYNTNVRNQYETSAERDRRQVEYEQRYKALEAEPQPRVVDVRVHFDIRPETRTLRMTGRYRLENKTQTPIGTIYVNLVYRSVTTHRLSLGKLDAASKVDDRHGFHSFALPEALAPGATIDLDFDLEYAPKGFKNGGATGVAVANGTFVNNSYLPLIGYLKAGELEDDDDRRKHKLGSRPRMADLKDEKARQRNYISADADWISFTASACTSPDQVAFVPGYLERTWLQGGQEGGRRCFAFTSRAKILHFFSVLSARYATRRDVYKDRFGEVAIEVHHHPGHDYNVGRMIEGVKAGLAYFNQNFSPYQHQQLRILEFPLYQQFAQAFPNTVPYSESIGFIAKVDAKNPKDVDYPYYVTAHEVAHQWWAHQIVGGDVQGATMLSETLSQYSALMVMKQRYGALHMKRFLRHELDSYLRNRALERKKELPLVRVEDQAYIHYNKGSLAFYALADAIGEDRVNQALKALLAKFAFRGPPYPTSLDLMAELERVTPPERRALLTDLLETITLFENRALSAKARPIGAGEHEVTVELTAKKLRADELGTEAEVPLDELVDVGVLDEEGKPLLLEKRRVRAGAQTVVMRVKGRPARAGIDPLNKLVDRQPDDNVASVGDEGSTTGK